MDTPDKVGAEVVGRIDSGAHRQTGETSSIFESSLFDIGATLESGVEGLTPGLREFAAMIVSERVIPCMDRPFAASERDNVEPTLWRVVHEAYGITQREIAEAWGVSPATASRIINRPWTMDFAKSVVLVHMAYLREMDDARGGGVPEWAAHNTAIAEVAGLFERYAYNSDEMKRTVDRKKRRVIIAALNDFALRLSPEALSMVLQAAMNAAIAEAAEAERAGAEHGEAGKIDEILSIRQDMLAAFEAAEISGK